MRICTLGLTCLLLLPGIYAYAVDPDFQFCVTDFPLTPQTRILTLYGHDSARIDALTDGQHRTAADLEAGSVWDFSGATSDVDFIIQFGPVNTLWSCSVGNCPGLDPVNVDILMVSDEPARMRRDLLALDYDGDATLYMRAQVVDDGSNSQQTICYDATTDSVFLSFPGPGGCLRSGDAWSFDHGSLPFCTQGGSFDDPCATTAPEGGFTGTIDGRVVGAGTLYLPSGHVVDAMLIEQDLSLQTHLNFVEPCTVFFVNLEAYGLMWLVPHYGIVMQLNSPEGAVDLSWEAGDAVTSFGLLPPVSLQVAALGTDSITVSWEPGNDTRYIDEWVVHWGESSGLDEPPPFTSELVGDTIPVDQTSYTIEGLTLDTTYYVSVTSKFTYTDIHGITTDYRSVVLPDTVGSDIDGDGVRDTMYPPEVSAAPQAVQMLRNWLDEINPAPTPPVADVLPLDPVTDLYRSGVSSPFVDDEPGVLTDLTRPLIFYALDTTGSIRLTKTATEEIQIQF